MLLNLPVLNYRKCGGKQISLAEFSPPATKKLLSSPRLKPLRQTLTSTRDRDQFSIRQASNQDKDQAPHVCCRTCATTLSKWLHGKRKAMPFAVPMIWREPTNHIDDCYFCMVPPASGGFTRKKKRTIKYPNIQSALRPVLHAEGLPIPQPPTDFSISSDEEDLDVSHNSPQASTSDVVAVSMMMAFLALMTHFLHIKLPRFS
ncbi:hypothetical protein AVEN_46374-1 [Araneus ventricosus]|uniref:Uncharacterized protein n=1 Tax=Araneus ventricosus TaxID=182803 RepID=A0A4Y2JLE4_ARAVE|nr:hypothetical protein AVEN_46374-1 [Araneus ventricosus]